MEDPMARVHKLQQKVREVVELARSETGFVAGSVYEARTRCGRQGCKCMGSDYRHTNRCVSFRDRGRSRTRTVPDHLSADTEAATDAYRNARAIRRLIAQVGKELLCDIDGVIAEAEDIGRRRMLARLQQSREDAK